MTDKYTDEELEMLSEEEREALTAEEDETPPPPADEEEIREEAEPLADDKRVAEGSDQPGEEAEPPPPAEEPKQQAGSPGVFVPQLKSDVDVDAVKAEMAELKKQYEDGDLDLDQDAYEEQRDALRDQIKDHEHAIRYNQQMQEQLWQYEQDLFFKQFPEYRENVALRGALKEAFGVLDADEANQGKSGLDLLSEARLMVEQMVRQSEQSPEPPSPPKREMRTPEMEKAPPPKTLAFTPPAAENETGRDEFAHLDRLQGPDLEEALAKMTPEQERRYLRMGG